MTNYIVITIILLALFLFNSRRHKLKRRDKKSKSFKTSYFEKKKSQNQDSELDKK